MNWLAMSKTIARVYMNPTHMGDMDTATWVRAFNAVGDMKLTADELAQRAEEMSVVDCGYVDPLDFDMLLDRGDE